MTFAIDALLSEHEVALNSWLDALYTWNKRINLTSIPRTEAWERHARDSLRLVPHLTDGCATLIDVGSGCGAPGIPLAIVCPRMQVTLLEADHRKAAFLLHLKGLLYLDNVDVVAERAEVIGHHPTHRETYDAAVSRATAPAPVLCELALPLVKLGGQLLASTSTAKGAAERCRDAAVRCGGDDPTAQSDGVLCVTKITPTPDIYPRRIGVPHRHPL